MQTSVTDVSNQAKLEGESEGAMVLVVLPSKEAVRRSERGLRSVLSGLTPKGCTWSVVLLSDDKHERGEAHEAHNQCQTPDDEAPGFEGSLKIIQDQVVAAYAKTIGCDRAKVGLDLTFSQLGGQPHETDNLSSILRATFNIDIPSSIISSIGNMKVRSVVEYIDARRKEGRSSDGQDIETEARRSDRWWLLCLQLVPLLLVYPSRHAFWWTAHLYVLSLTRFWEDNGSLCGRLANLVLSIIAAWGLREAVFPIFGILTKWVIIGRYRPGSYPMWGSYHTRWWMVQKIVSLCGMGHFALTHPTQNLYHRLMGAKIGSGVRLTEVNIGEWDLLDIRAGATLTKCHCRPFAAEKNTTMYLGRIVIGERATVGVLSHLAPGVEILADTNLSSNSSSWEQNVLSEEVEQDEAVSLNPHWLLSILITSPLQLFCWAFACTPWLGAHVGVLYVPPAGSDTPLRVILDWFQGNPTVAFMYVAAIAHALIEPLLIFSFAVAFRWLSSILFGPLPADPCKFRSQFRIWQSTMMRFIFSERRLRQVNRLMGQHHEARSGVLRALGAEVGRRVCWPTDGGPSIVDYHLVKIGDDVVFGEDSHLITSDKRATAAISIGDGAVIADKTCILPGVHVGARATIAFGTTTLPGKHYPEMETLVGCCDGDVEHSDSYGARLWGVPDVKQDASRERRDSDETLVEDEDVPPSSLEEGDAKKRLDKGHQKEEARRRDAQARTHKPSADSDFAPDVSPYKKAYFEREAPSSTLSPAATLAFSLFMTAFSVLFWSVPSMSSMKLTSRIFVERFVAINPTYDIFVVYLFNYVSTIALTAPFVILGVGIVVAAKRLLVGRFEPGVYEWHKSSFCQRWQVLNAFEKLLVDCYVERGLISLLTGTQWLVWYYRSLGAKIGDNCSIYANGWPSLMLTEANLIEVGDRVTIDDAGIVCHLDRRGSVQTDRIKIGNGCVLRSGSTLMCGTVMESNSMLLEHTLVLPGDTVPASSVQQGRVAKEFQGNRLGTLGEGG